MFLLASISVVITASGFWLTWMMCLLALFPRQPWKPGKLDSLGLDNLGLSILQRYCLRTAKAL